MALTFASYLVMSQSFVAFEEEEVLIHRPAFVTRNARANLVMVAAHVGAVRFVFAEFLGATIMLAPTYIVKLVSN